MQMETDGFTFEVNEDGTGTLTGPDGGRVEYDAEMPVTDITPGMVLTSDHWPSDVEILRSAETWRDTFGRDMLRYWGKRLDTAAEGYVFFGPSARVTVVSSAVRDA